MSLHSRYIASSNLAFYSSHRKNIVDAVGPDVVKCFEDFSGPVVATSDALVGWTTTLVETGLGGESTVTIPDGSAGVLLLTTDNAENDGINLQKIGENFGFASSQNMTYFGIRFKISEKLQSDFIVGLCITDTTLLGGMTDGVYFRKVDGSANVAVVTEKDSTETETTAVTAMVDDTFITLEFCFEGSKVEFFVNGASVASHTANIPDDELLTPSMHFLTGEAAVKTMTVDWVRAIQIGR
jgi:hypothetical protein